MSTLVAQRRAVIIYESMFGNTMHIADAIARGLRSRGYDAIGVDVRLAALDTPTRADLVVLGAPTHAFSLSRPATREDAVRQGAAPASAATGLREWLNSQRPSTGDQPTVAIFDTRVAKVRRLPFSAARSTARLVQRLGFRVIGRPEGFLVDDVRGPLRGGELDRAEAWARDLADVVAASDPSPARPVSGSTPSLS